MEIDGVSIKFAASINIYICIHNVYAVRCMVIL